MSEAMKFRKKPVVIEAWQSFDNAGEVTTVCRYCDNEIRRYGERWSDGLVNAFACYHSPTKLHVPAKPLPLNQ